MSGVQYDSSYDTKFVYQDKEIFINWSIIIQVYEKLRELSIYQKSDQETKFFITITLYMQRTNSH